MADSMYFGTQERMTWIKCPNSGMTRNRTGWKSSGTYLNGGGWTRQSATKHYEMSLVWSFLNHLQVREINDYYLGVYGDGPIYWLDTFAMGTNALPAHWSIPRLAADDAPPLVKGRRPTLSDTAANTIHLPTKTATYELRSGDQFDSLHIPVPEGFVAHIAAWGSRTGDAHLVLGGEEVVLTTISEPAPTWTSTGSAVLTAAGEGFLSLAGVIVQVLPAPETIVFPGLLTSPGLPTSPSLLTAGTETLYIGGQPSVPRFLSGEGHSGMAFKTEPNIVGYSSPEAIDYQSLTADFIEVGAWQQ